MTANSEVFDELKNVMTSALLQMHILVNCDTAHQEDFLSMIKLFLIGIISTAADLAETTSPGATAYLYAEVEAAVKQGGLKAVRDAQAKDRSYSVANIAPDDFEAGMNYLGQELGITLFKHIHDLPASLRKPEMLLRAIEALLTNVLDQKFGQGMREEPHKILDQLCQHVHTALKNLKLQRAIH